MIEIVYLLVALLATIFGSMAGLGGGVIIKPLLDFIGGYNVSTINLLSTFTVFSMAVVSIVRYIIGKVKIDGLRTMFLAFGSVIGGIVGNEMFTFFVRLFDEELIGIVQSSLLSILLVLTLLFVNFRDKLKTYNIENVIVILLTGLVLGLIASFLGIGGGPINVAVLILIFSMSTKSAAVHSVLIILFSQFSKIVTVGMFSGFDQFDLSMLYYMIPGGVVGGLIGSSLNKKIDETLVKKIFNLLLIFVILLNVYNLIIVALGG